MLSRKSTNGKGDWTNLYFFSLFFTKIVYQAHTSLIETQVSVQARIHTGFHRFTEIGQIFHNRYIKEKTFQVARLHPRRMELANILSERLSSKPRKGDFRKLKTKKFITGDIPRAPQKLGPSALVYEGTQKLHKVMNITTSTTFVHDCTLTLS